MKQGVIVAWNYESLWGSIELKDGSMVNFHSTYYHGVPTTWPRVGVLVDVIYNDRGNLLSVHQRTQP